MWRPDKKEWARTRSKWFDDHYANSGVKYKSFEAGANAMLEALLAKLIDLGVLCTKEEAETNNCTICKEFWKEVSDETTDV